MPAAAEKFFRISFLRRKRREPRSEQVVLNDGVGNMVRFVVDVGEFELPAFDDGADQGRYRQRGHDRQDDDRVEELVVQHAEILADGGRGEGCGELRHGHQTGA